MRILLKPLKEWGIGLKNNIFIKSKIKLSFLYTLITYLSIF